MRKSLFAALLSASALSSNALAADLPVPVEVVPAISWTGFYIGAYAGGGGIHYDSDFFGVLNIDGFGGQGWQVGGNLGYDHQFGRFVLGVLGDVHWSNFEAEASALGIVNASLESQWGFDVLGRAGFLVHDRALLYALGGYSREEWEGRLAIPLLGVGLQDEEDADGWTVGAGIEVMANDRVSVKGEYRFTNFDELDFETGGAVSLEPHRHLALFGVNYRFGGPFADQGMAPVGGPFFDGNAPANWTGLYLGVAGGGGMTNYDTEVLGGLLSVDGFSGEGGLVEGTLGFDYQANDRFVLGVLGDARWSNIDSDASLAIGGLNINAELETEWGFDALGRAGVLVNNRSLLYALGGYSWQEWHGSATIAVVGAGAVTVEDDEESDGWTLGGGLEVLATDNLSFKGEYRFTGFDDFDFGTGGILTLEPDQHTARVGVNYKLNGLFR